MENEDQLGALWIKQSANGPYMSGNIEIDGKKINIVCFKNKYKEEDRHPDWQILKSRPREN